MWKFSLVEATKTKSTTNHLYLEYAPKFGWVNIGSLTLDLEMK